MQSIFQKLNRYFCVKWQLAVLDLNSGRWIISSSNKNIPYLKAENANGRHILLQPALSISPYYMMVDDLSITTIHLHHKYSDGTWKPGRMVVETSPKNYQVWIHSNRSLPLDEKRHWLKKLCNDPGADPNNRWGRCPGFRNRKEKHRDSKNGYPMAKLIWIDWKYQADIPQYKSCHTAKTNRIVPLSPQPLKGCVCLNKFISRSDYEKGDESKTDFSYALALVRRNYPQSNIRNRLLTERTNWKNHNGIHKKDAYITRTIEKTIAIVQNS